jgi:hypothetical protein
VGFGGKENVGDWRLCRKGLKTLPYIRYATIFGATTLNRVIARSAATKQSPKIKDRMELKPHPYENKNGRFMNCPYDKHNKCYVIINAWNEFHPTYTFTHIAAQNAAIVTFRVDPLKSG